MLSAAGDPLTGYSLTLNLARTVTTVWEPSVLTMSSQTLTSSGLKLHVPVNGSGWLIEFQFIVLYYTVHHADTKMDDGRGDGGECLSGAGTDR